MIQNIKVKVLIPMYEPLEVVKCKKCGRIIAEPKELIRMVMKLDALIRGSIERHIDEILERENLLSSALEMFKEPLSPTVKSFEDALFGYVIGRTLQFSFDVLQIHYRRPLSDEEFIEIGKMLTRRAMEIKSKITLIANR